MGNMKDIGLLDCEDRPSIEENFKRVQGGGGGDILDSNGKLKSEVLPDGYPYDTGTFYYDNSGYQEGDEVVFNGQMTYFKVSSDTLSYNDMLGAKFNAPFGESVITENELEYTDGVYCSVRFFVISVYEDNFQFGEMEFPTAGIYMITPENGIFSMSKDGIVPLDPKFLPEGIGGAFVVELDGSAADGYTCNKTGEEIVAAIDEGKLIEIRIAGVRIYNYERVYNNRVEFDNFMMISDDQMVWVRFAITGSEVQTTMKAITLTELLI